MKVPDFTIEHLKRLPLRAIVAFAARCARRVQHLAQGSQGEPGGGARNGTIEAALRIAEDFARGAESAPNPSVIEAIDALEAANGGPPGSRRAYAAAAQAAHAAKAAQGALKVRELEEYKPLEGKSEEARKSLSTLQHLGVDLTALNAFTAAVEAYTAVGYDNEPFVSAALKDYDKLIEMELGRYPEPGGPIDPSPGGPLGRL